MKGAEMKKLFVVLSSIMIFAPIQLLATMSQTELLHILTNKGGILRMRHPQPRHDAMKSLVARGDASLDELSGSLVLAAHTLEFSSDDHDLNAQRFAITALGSFGTENALPYLEETVKGKDLGRAKNAMSSLVKLSERLPAALQILSTAMNTERAEDDDFRQATYFRIENEFDFANLSDERSEQLIAFLLSATETETHQAAQLDTLLCKVKGDYAESQERLCFVRRIAAVERQESKGDGYFSSVEHKLKSVGGLEQ